MYKAYNKCDHLFKKQMYGGRFKSKINILELTLRDTEDAQRSTEIFNFNLSATRDASVRLCVKRKDGKECKPWYTGKNVRLSCENYLLSLFMLILNHRKF